MLDHKKKEGEIIKMNEYKIEEDVKKRLNKTLIKNYKCLEEFFIDIAEEPCQLEDYDRNYFDFLDEIKIKIYKCSKSKFMDNLPEEKYKNCNCPDDGYYKHKNMYFNNLYIYNIFDTNDTKCGAEMQDINIFLYFEDLELFIHGILKCQKYGYTIEEKDEISFDKKFYKIFSLRRKLEV